MEATASDEAGVARVELLVDGSPVATDTTAPYGFTWDTRTVADGTHALGIRAYDTGGNATTAEVTVRVDNLAPTAAFTAPAAGAVVRGAVLLSASASDAVEVARVEFYADGTLVGTHVAREAPGAGGPAAGGAGAGE